MPLTIEEESQTTWPRVSLEKAFFECFLTYIIKKSSFCSSQIKN